MRLRLPKFQRAITVRQRQFQYPTSTEPRNAQGLEFEVKARRNSSDCGFERRRQIDTGKPGSPLLRCECGLGKDRR